jgi:hypothetical protein
MATPTSNFIIKKYDGFGGNFLDSKYLGAAYDTGKPHILQDTMTRIFSSKTRFFTGKLLTGMTGGSIGGVTEIETEMFRWRMYGDDVISARIVETLDPTNTTPGLGGGQFRIKLDLDFYEEPDVLLPEDEDYPIQIIGGGIEDGNGTIYTCQLETDDPDAFLPVEYLEVGREFDKGWTTVASEYNDRFGTQQHSSTFMLESQIGAFAEKFTVTDKAWRHQGRAVIEMRYTDPVTGQDKTVDKFLPMAEAKMEHSLLMGMEKQAWIGKRSNKQGPNKYWKKTGPGIEEQLLDGHVEYYNSTLTTTRMKDFLLSVLFGKVNEEDRHMVAVTGTIGSLMFHDMLAAEASSFLTVDTNYIERQPGKAKRLLSYGAQFTHYQGPEGIEVTLVKNPLYDDRTISKRTHPIFTEAPIRSSRFTFLDFGGNSAMEGKQNVQMLRVKDTYRRGYVAGTHTPMGPVKGGQAGSLKAGYDLFTEGTNGIVMLDSTRGGALIFDDQL